MLKKLLHHTKDFYHYTFYIGIVIRINLRKKGSDDPEVLEMNSKFWLGILNSFLISAFFLPICLDRNMLISITKGRYFLLFAIPFLIKFCFDHYSFYWKKDWIKIVEKFENEINATTKKCYLILFVSIIICGFFIIYIRWFN